MSSTIIFDFDGTVCVGSGPVLAYAREVAAHAGAGFLDATGRELRSFEAGEPSRYRDGYDIVGSLADAAGVDPEARQAAYLASRGSLPSSGAEPAPGLAGLLGRLPEDARIVLATNAPRDGLDETLAAWGLSAAFDEIRDSVGKPDGLAPIVREALARGPVLSIGDMVENDLAPAAALGAATALVGATAATSPADVTMRGTTLADLAHAIVAWAGASHDLLTSPTLLPER
ncbi:HAD family hydrolase [Microbacterium karelineae]|uniref:HAD family hydrolase n=1 Tax=Microbacterium karelineae TaxID=2654283 RepID=UPI0018D3F9D3|nr:HAD family hydrolase [Microbacterium karelineae]